MGENYKWVKVAEDFELPTFVKEGGVMTIEVEGKKLALAKLKNVYYALNDRCPHAGGSLGEGWCEGHTVVCPVHRLKFDLQTGRDNGQGYNVLTYPVKQEKDGLYIGFEQKNWWKFW